jgi:hypothetical protein
VLPADPLRRARFIWSGLALSALACGGTTRAPTVERTPEAAWLADIGTGAEQNAQVCARGAGDRVAHALCAPNVTIQSLDDLYRALRLGPSDPRRLAATAHSLSLSGRSVSAANPRVMVFTDTNAPGGSTYGDIVATAFARGQQLVELVGLDPATYEYNFYLLSFNQACSLEGCTPADLLGPSVESGWLDWTLYSDVDLEDTPLNCTTCHRPFGAGTHKQLLMRQVTDPWMHWGDFRGGDESMCPQKPPAGTPVQVVATADGLDLLRTLEGETSTYAGVPVAELHAAKSGEAMSDFLVDAELLISASPLPPHSYGQLGVLTRETLCERFYTGDSPSWEQDRRTSQAGGFPFPYYAPDVLDAERRSELLAGREAVWQRERARDAFDVAASWLAADVPAAAGFVPREGDAASNILRGLCVRCHAATADSALARARFNAEAETIEPAAFNEVAKRLALPARSPKAMPPRPAGELPDWARDRLLSYLAERCTIPGACRAPSSTPPTK